MRANRAVMILALGCGCAASRNATQEGGLEKPPLTIAVIGFGGSDEKSSDAENGCVLAVLDAGLRAVDRRQIIRALPNENDVDFTTVGRVLGCDLIIDGGVARGNVETLTRLEPRLISTHSASVLGAARTTGRVRLTREAGRKLCTELLRQLP